MRANNQFFSGPNLTITGNGNTITGPNCTVKGNNNILSGPNCTAKGNNNTLTGPNCTAKGNNNKVTGPNGRAVGTGNTVNSSGGSSVVFRGSNYGVSQIIGGSSRFFVNGVEVKPKEKRERDEEDIKFIEGPSSREEEHDIVAKEDARTCIICCVNEPICIVLPCAQKCVCVTCARKLCFKDEHDLPKEVGTLPCPMCRVQVEAIKRVYE